MDRYVKGVKLQLRLVLLFSTSTLILLTGDGPMQNHHQSYRCRLLVSLAVFRLNQCHVATYPMAGRWLTGGLDSNLTILTYPHGVTQTPAQPFFSHRLFAESFSLGHSL